MLAVCCKFCQNTPKIPKEHAQISKNQQLVLQLVLKKLNYWIYKYGKGNKAPDCVDTMQDLGAKEKIKTLRLKLCQISVKMGEKIL